LADNRVTLTGHIETIDARRVSPAGVPSVRFTLRHRSTQTEAGHPRQVDFVFRVAVIGELAEVAASMEAGADVSVEGFLAQSSSRSSWPALHATDLRRI
jgi:primosomal replication protein N